MSAIQLFDLNGEQRFTGTSLGGVQQSPTVTLTDAQIRHLPTLAIPVVAAPGDGKMIVVAWSVWELDNTRGAYSNLTNFSTSLNYGATLMGAANAYDEATQGAFADASTIHIIGISHGLTDTNAAPLWLAERGDVNNVGLTVHASNASDGDLHDGNAANTLAVTVGYSVVAV